MWYALCVTQSASRKIDLSEALNRDFRIPRLSLQGAKWCIFWQNSVKKPIRSLHVEQFRKNFVFSYRGLNKGLSDPVSPESTDRYGPIIKLISVICTSNLQDVLKVCELFKI